MSAIFINVINMSISAGYAILAILLIRLLLKKAPKWISVMLWCVAGIRLIIPFSVESVLSLIPSAETVSPDIMTDTSPTINSGLSFINSSLNPIISDSFSPMPGDSANPLQIWIPVLTALWLIGVVSMLLYALISYLRVMRRLECAVLLRDNVYQSENVVSPFVIGFVKPKIYLPFGISDKAIPHVLAHEMAHVCRKDHILKPFGFLLLAIHWFNPLVWLGYAMLCRDVELACDERVIKELDCEGRADYSEALLGCSARGRNILPCPLAFGEVGVKGRIKSVLNYKKPAFWIVAIAVLACVFVVVCFLTNPQKNNGETDPDKLNETQIELMERYPEYFGIDASGGLDVYVWEMAKECYGFTLLPHSETPREWLSRELWDASRNGTDAEMMRQVLATYTVDENKIYIIPWANPISSYASDWQIIEVGDTPEEIEAKYNAYVERVRLILFPDSSEK